MNLMGNLLGYGCLVLFVIWILVAIATAILEFLASLAKSGVALVVEFWYIPSAMLVGFVIFLPFWIRDYMKAEKERDLENERLRALAAAQKEEEKRQKAEEEVRAEEAARRKAEEDRRQRYLEEQEELHDGMVSLTRQAMESLEQLPRHLRSAEESLGLAKDEFAGGYLSPFWDAIEKAAGSLGQFDDCVRGIKEDSEGYRRLLGIYKGEPPQFPLAKQPGDVLSLSKRTADRLGNLLREAQKDPNYSSIYEARRTNQILIAGFENLGDALRDIGFQVSDSIAELRASVDSVSLAIDDSIDSNSREFEVIAQSRQDSLRWKEEAGRREENVIHLLTEIQEDVNSQR